MTVDGKTSYFILDLVENLLIARDYNHDEDYRDELDDSDEDGGVSNTHFFRRCTSLSVVLLVVKFHIVLDFEMGACALTL